MMKKAIQRVYNKRMYYQYRIEKYVTKARWTKDWILSLPRWIDDPILTNSKYSNMSIWNRIKMWWAYRPMDASYQDEEDWREEKI